MTSSARGTIFVFASRIDVQAEQTHLYTELDISADRKLCMNRCDRL